MCRLAQVWRKSCGRTTSRPSAAPPRFARSHLTSACPRPAVHQSPSPTELVDDEHLDRLAADRDRLLLAELLEQGLDAVRRRITPASRPALPEAGDPRGVVRVRVVGKPGWHACNVASTSRAPEGVGRSSTSPPRPPRHSLRRATSQLVGPAIVVAAHHQGQRAGARATHGAPAAPLGDGASAAPRFVAVGPRPRFSSSSPPRWSQDRSLPLPAQPPDEGVRDRLAPESAQAPTDDMPGTPSRP